MNGFNYNSLMRLYNQDVADELGIPNEGVFTLRSLVLAIKASAKLQENVDWSIDLLTGELKRSGPKGASAGWGQVVAIPIRSV